MIFLRGRLKPLWGCQKFLYAEKSLLSHFSSQPSSLLVTARLPFLGTVLSEPCSCRDTLVQLPSQTMTRRNSDDWHNKERFNPSSFLVLEPQSVALQLIMSDLFCSHLTLGIDDLAFIIARIKPEQQFLTNRFIIWNNLKSDQLLLMFEHQNGSWQNCTRHSNGWKPGTGIKWSWHCFKTLPIMSNLAYRTDKDGQLTVWKRCYKSVKYVRRILFCDTAWCCFLFVVAL